MNLLTHSLRSRLLANGRTDGDHFPVVKFFLSVGAATWLFSELDEDGDILFGLCDLGFGCPELGSASLSEIAAVQLPLELSIERDLAFEPSHSLGVYAEAARACGQITETPEHLARAAQRLARENRPSPPPCPSGGG